MMDKLFLQKIYADNVGARLERFKVQQHSPYRANFRCPVCGDSATNRFKRRGFFVEKNGSLMFHCHNECGTMNFENFLHKYYSDLYTMYKFEIIKQWKEEKQDGRHDNQGNRGSDSVEDVQRNGSRSLIDIPLAIDVDVASRYINDRKIPKQFHDDIFYTDKFFKFVNQQIPEKFPEEYNEKDDRRIILPIRDYDGSIFGVVGRSIDKSNSVKYLTIKFDENKPKIFGLDRLDKSKFAYVLEGPIDSYFVDNAVAFAGTDGSPELIFEDKSNYAIVLDNQPRSHSVLKKYEKYIDLGNKLVIWPSDISDKDINQMVIDGVSQPEIQAMLRKNTFDGLKLKIMFTQWRKL